MFVAESCSNVWIGEQKRIWVDMDTSGLEGGQKHLFLPLEVREMVLQKRFPSLHSMLQDRKQTRIYLPRFGADFQEKFIPHWLLITLASNFSGIRESWSRMDCVSPIKPSRLWKAVLSLYLTIFFGRFRQKCELFTSVLTED